MASQIDSQNLATKFIAIFPAKYEEGTIENSNTTAKQSHSKPDVILIDSYSTDRTTRLAEKVGAIVIQQPTQPFPTKV